MAASSLRSRHTQRCRRAHPVVVQSRTRVAEELPPSPFSPARAPAWGWGAGGRTRRLRSAAAVGRPSLGGPEAATLERRDA